MNKLAIYEAVNAQETLEGLGNIIRSLADEEGMIQGRTRKFDAERMAELCKGYKEYYDIGRGNVLTREFGIRQQAMYILYYTR